jgi:FkbM family methyltransferase
MTPARELQERSAFGVLYPPAPYRVLLKIARATMLGRGRLRRWLKSFFLHNGIDILDADLDGIKMRIHLSGNACEWKFACNPRFNSSEIDFLVGGSAKSAAVFIDIGANAGVFSLSLAAAGAQVLAIEPHPLALSRLRFNVEVNNFQDRICIINSAIAERSGMMGLVVSDGDLGSSGFRANETGTTIDVRVRPLLELVQEFGLDRVDGLKIDVEGYEDRALLPFFNDAPEGLWPRRIVMEHVHRTRWVRDCIKELVALGYQVAGVDRNNTMLLLPRGR